MDNGLINNDVISRVLEDEVDEVIKDLRGEVRPEDVVIMFFGSLVVIPAGYCFYQRWGNG